MLSLFYTRREIATRVSILYSESSATYDVDLSYSADIRRQHHCYCCGWAHQCSNVCHVGRCTWYRRVAMAIHHPRCGHIWYCGHCALGSPRPSSHHPMAEARGTAAGSFSNGARYCRSRGKQRCLGRSQTSRQGPQTLVPYSTSNTTFVRLWLQFLLPNCGQDSGIQHDRHPCNHGAALHFRWSLQRSPCLVLGTEEREVLAYRGWNGCRSCRFHHGSSIPQHWCSIRVPIPVCHWCILVSIASQDLTWS